MKLSKELVLERLRVYSGKLNELKLEETSEGLKIWRLIDSRDFNLMKFRIELIKTRYSNEFITEDEDINVITLHLKREYIKDKLVTLVIKFIKNLGEDLVIALKILNEIDYEESTGREFFY